MIRNGMWDVLSLSDPRNKEKRWDLLLHQSRFPLDYVKSHVQSLLKGSEADQYVVHNLTWSVVYLRITLSNTLLQKVLKLVPLTATGPEVFVATMTTFLSDYYDALEETLNHMKSIKLKSYPGERYRLLCRNIGRRWAPWECQGLQAWSTRVNHLHLWGYFWLQIPSVGYSEVQGSYGVYQETSCVWHGCRITRGSYNLWVPYTRGYARIPRSCGFKVVGTGYKQRKF